MPTSVPLESWTARCPRCGWSCSDRDHICQNCHKGRVKWSHARDGRRFFCDYCDHSYFPDGIKCEKCPAFIDFKYVRAGAARLYGEFLGVVAILSALAAASAAFLKHLS